MPTATLTREQAELRLQLGVRAAAKRRSQPSFVERYYDRPDLFVLECFIWKDGEGPAEHQLQWLRDLITYKRIARRGPHGIGKTTFNAWVILWFALTSEAAGKDWKAPTTASVWRQLKEYLWPEVHKWAHRLRWEVIGRPAFDPRAELLDLSLKLEHGSAFAVASDNAATIEGAHADRLLYVFDEAKIIPEDTFDSAEGAFSTAGTGGTEAFAVAVSTPGEPHGRFYDIHKRAPGYEDWHVAHVTREQAIATGRMTTDWANARLAQWGEGDPRYQNRVLGEFAASDETSIIPLAWIEAANERWLALEQSETMPDHLDALGVDVADQGRDNTVMAFRSGNVVTELKRTRREDTMQTAGRVRGVLRANPDAVAIVDVIGIGAGVVARLREQGVSVAGFNAAERASSGGTRRGGRSIGTIRDRSGELGFVNKRAQVWWQVREMLDPANAEDVALPPDDRLTGDLTAPHWRVVSGGKIQVESKDDIGKRIGRSTDDGDAVVMSFWQDAGVSLLEAWSAGTIDCPKCGRPVTLYGEGDERCGYCGAAVNLDVG